jgi:hypothetical protein
VICARALAVCDRFNQPMPATGLSVSVAEMTDDHGSGACCATMTASRRKSSMTTYRQFETHCPTCGQRYNAAGLHWGRLVISDRVFLVLLAVAFAAGIGVGLLLAF